MALTGGQHAAEDLPQGALARTFARWRHVSILPGGAGALVRPGGTFGVYARTDPTGAITRQVTLPICAQPVELEAVPGGPREARLLSAPGCRDQRGCVTD